MQSTLRLAARRAARAASPRGVATTTITTTTEAERERVASLIQREVRAQMLAAEERAAAECARAREAEWSTRLRAFKLEQEVPWYESSAWMNGYLTCYMSWMAASTFLTMFIILKP